MSSIKSTVKKELVITLELTEETARWLKIYMQNPRQENEPEIDYEMRGNFWRALNEVKIS